MSVSERVFYKVVSRCVCNYLYLSVSEYISVYVYISVSAINGFINGCALVCICKCLHVCARR